MKKLTSLVLAFIFAIIMPCYSFATSPNTNENFNISTTATSPSGTVYEYSGYVPIVVSEYFTMPKNKNVYLFFACTEDCTIELTRGDVLVWSKHFTANRSATKYLIKSNMATGQYRIIISANSYDSCYVSLSIMPTLYT